MLPATLVLLVLCAATFHAATYLLMIFEQRAHGQPRPAAKAGARCGAWLGEFGALMVVLVLKPFSWIAPRKLDPSGDRPPVVLVHGLGSGHTSMALLAARLRAGGRVAVVLSYAYEKGGVEATARALAEELRQVATAAGAGRIDVVTHGIGGVLMRVAAHRYGVAAILANLVTIGCPHQGTTLASMLTARRFADLRPRSPYLTRLADEPPLPSKVSCTNIISDFDALVFPPDLAYCPIAMNISIEYIGHYSMLFSERVYRLILENLERPGLNKYV